MSWDSTSHFMWPEFVPEGEFLREDARCSCGFVQRETWWLDDVILSDIALSGSHPEQFLIAYPTDEFPQTTGGVKSVRGHDERDLSDAELRELLAQPDLPDEFRRAAAVHLEN